jgi:outer membrane protein OmpA-like peptidoglycan-associated protein
MAAADDDNQGLVLGVVFGVIALVVAIVAFVGINKVKAAKVVPPVVALVAPSAAAPPATAAVAQALAEAASVKVVDGVVKFYFASGKSDVAAGGNEALATVVSAVAAGKRAVISGFHDATGDPAKNAELAKQRAFKVRDALTALGVAADKIELKKPEQMLASGSDSEARRVEVAVQ